MNAWSHLPNAHHIDRVIKSVKAHPKIWGEAWYASDPDSRPEFRAVGPVVVAVVDADRNDALKAALDAARPKIWDPAGDASMNAIMALIAYDHSAKYLDMTSEQLHIWAILSEDLAAFLLIAAVIAFEKIDELEMV